MHELRKHFDRRNPQPGKPCRRFPRLRKTTIALSDALIYCEGQDDIVATLCMVLGQKPSYMAIQTAWPWLETQIKVPCRCQILHPSVLVTLCHLFDHHVTDLQTWSFSRLMQWVHDVQRRLAPAGSPSEDQELKDRSKPLMGCFPDGQGKGHVKGRCCRCRCHSKTRPTRTMRRPKVKKGKRMR